jgi:hypothetical protein
MKLEFSREIFEKYSNTKFYENPSRERRDTACKGTDVRTEMAKLIVAIRNFANAPNKSIKWGGGG